MKERIEKLKLKGSHAARYDEETIKELRSIHKAIYGEDVCSTCPGNLYEAYMKIIKSNIENIEIMNNSKYKIKKGILLDTYLAKGVPQGHYTSQSVMDDKTAEALYKRYPSKFEPLKEGESGPADSKVKKVKEPKVKPAKTEAEVKEESKPEETTSPEGKTEGSNLAE